MVFLRGFHGTPPLCTNGRSEYLMQLSVKICLSNSSKENITIVQLRQYKTSDNSVTGFKVSKTAKMVDVSDLPIYPSAKSGNVLRHGHMLIEDDTQIANGAGRINLSIF